MAREGLRRVANTVPELFKNSACTEYMPTCWFLVTRYSNSNDRTFEIAMGATGTV